MNINQRVDLLRESMKKKNMAAYIIPASDPHISEYVAEKWKAREWISGFDGSAGTAIVTLDHAGLWTDVRYFIQAEKQLAHSEFQLHKIENQFSPQFMDWIIENVPSGATVGVDGWCISQGQYQQFADKMKTIKGKLEVSFDLIGEIWADRPELPTEKVFQHELKFTGRSRAEKLKSIRQEMKKIGTSHYLLPALDDIGWTLNLRGRDVDCNPVFISYLLVGEKDVNLYIDNQKVGDDIREKLEKDGIEIRPYDSILSDINKLPEHSAVLIDTTQVNSMLYRGINGKPIAGKSIAKWHKACKNDIEIKNVRRCMEKDGAALAESFYWLEKNVGNKLITEYDLSRELIKNRSIKDHYYGESFHAIVGYKSNGAIMHYRPTADSSSEIHPNGILLVDSGGQFEDGTTDITRTFTLDAPTMEQRKHYTLVLKGMISLTQAIFPSGTPGGQLDTLARQFLWKNRLDFGHGTGHGVGFFMNVHEPPQGFANIHSERGKTRMQHGMITSNEPGFYLEGAYGIRLENLILTVEEEGGFMHFETLTLYPFSHRLTDASMLTSEEIQWLNQYHDDVFKRVSSLLKDDSIKAWFKEKCGHF
jgi:Xaa-Pro aminopeptidase